MRLFFSDFFEVDPKLIERYGAFNVSLLADLPLFVDPFLIFNSTKPAYKALHEDIVKYLLFLRDKADGGQLSPGLIDAWYRFPEIRQNWLGFTVSSNAGRGLGKKFANALHQNLHAILANFGRETVTKGVHLEKLCLITEGVGRDSISDFTNNLIHGFLLDYTQAFTLKHVPGQHRRRVVVSKVRFNYATETWERGVFVLPVFRHSHVLLTPIDLLTKGDTWINKTDLVEDFDRIPDAIPNVELRAQVNNYFRSLLPRGKPPKAAAETNAARQTLLHFPDLIDYYIKYKEDHGDQAVSISAKEVESSRQLYLEQFRGLALMLERETAFYKVEPTSYEAARRRALFLKDVVENKGGHRLFYVRGQPVEREEDLQIAYRLTWFASSYDVSREVNDGRGPADFKVSRGNEKTLVEMKLAKNSQLERNLKNQAATYERASDADRTVKVILFFSAPERTRVENILRRLKLVGHPDVVLVDARNDNKPSGSKA